MYYKKTTLPEEDEIVICTVKRILPHSVFVSLDEYKNTEGMIHISEVSPGRIRNLRDFVKEGKTIVCKILNIRREKNHIDLSLRRVPLTVRRKKEEEYKQELKAEKLLEQFAKSHKTTLEDIYKGFGSQIMEKYSSLTSFFNQVLSNNIDLPKEIKIEKRLAEDLVEKIKEKIKLPEAQLEANIKLTSKDSAGIEKIKEIFKKTNALATKNKYKIKMTYLSAPRYNLQVTSSNFKNAEKILSEVSNFLVDEAEKQGCEAEWQKKS